MRSAALKKAGQEASEPRQRGRPPVPADRALTGRVRARVTPAQEAKFESLGGSAWLRRQIDRARIPIPGKRVAPWPDFAGQEIRDGDTIQHPDGERGRVVFWPYAADPGDRWRVVYEKPGPISRLSLQIGAKGQAKVVPE